MKIILHLLVSSCLALVPLDNKIIGHEAVVKAKATEVWNLNIPQNYAALDIETEDVKICSNDDATFALESISVVPDPPVLGQRLDITVTGTLNKVVSAGAKVQIGVYLSGFRIFQKVVDFCETLKDDQTLPQCPVQPGYLKISEGADMPSNIPPGNYKVMAVASDQDGQQMFCVQYYFKI